MKIRKDYKDITLVNTTRPDIAFTLYDPEGNPIYVDFNDRDGVDNPYTNIVQVADDGRILSDLAIYYIERDPGENDLPPEDRYYYALCETHESLVTLFEFRSDDPAELIKAVTRFLDDYDEKDALKKDTQA